MPTSQGTKAYIQSRNQSPSDKLQVKSTSYVTDPGNGIGSVADQLASGLQGVGSSINGTINFVSDTIDSIFSGGADDFFKGSVERVSPSDLRFNRSATTWIKTPEEKTQEELEKLKAASLIYPKDIGKYFMVFNFAEYKRPNAFDPPDIQPIESIVLPLSEDIFETYAVKWDETDTGLVGEVAGRSESSINDLASLDVEDSDNVEGNIERLLKNALGSGGSALARIASKVSPDATGVIEQTAGAILNPHPSVFFRGISLREHQFRWKLSAKSAEESETIKKIIKKFKNMMLPSFDSAASASILNYPYIVKPVFVPNSDYLFEFKWCGIRSMNAIYTPDAGASFYKDTMAPVSIQLSLTLQELEYFVSDDVKKESIIGTDIGNFFGAEPFGGGE